MAVGEERRLHALVNEVEELRAIVRKQQEHIAFLLERNEGVVHEGALRAALVTKVLHVASRRRRSGVPVDATSLAQADSFDLKRAVDGLSGRLTDVEMTRGGLNGPALRAAMNTKLDVDRFTVRRPWGVRLHEMTSQTAGI